jgi:hypothetical protein
VQERWYGVNLRIGRVYQANAEKEKVQLVGREKGVDEGGNSIFE